jgi:hypothetical protein
MTAYIVMTPKKPFGTKALKPCAIPKGRAFYVPLPHRSNRRRNPIYSTRINALNEPESYTLTHLPPGFPDGRRSRHAIG